MLFILESFLIGGNRKFNSNSAVKLPNRIEKSFLITAILMVMFEGPLVSFLNYLIFLSHARVGSFEFHQAPCIKHGVFPSNV